VGAVSAWWSAFDGVRDLVAQTRATRWMRGCDAGPGLHLDGRPTIAIDGECRIGARFHLASHPVQSHLVVGPGGIVEIGDDVSIAHGAALAAYRQVTIGDGTRIGPYVVLMDTDFHVAGDRTAQHASTPIVIGRRVRIGSRVTILRGSIIHDDANVEAGSTVSGTIAAGARVSGVPAREHAPPSAGGRESADLDGLPEVVMRVLGLSSPPAPDHGPDQIAQWDSLGSLKLLLALEEAFEITLHEEEVVRVRNVSDLAVLVERAQERRASSAI
jgi:acetyltransferase-like isoleucine patch superfamily enzyme/acyl carrier protein